MVRGGSLKIRRLSWELELSDLLFCLAPTAFFLIVTLPYWGQAPALDPLINYRDSANFADGGLRGLAAAGTKVHPPLFYSINALFFAVFGRSPGSYNLAGLAAFFCIAVTFYFLVKKVLVRRTAAVATWLLFANPLVIVNGFYLTHDLLIMGGLIFALGFGIARRKRALSWLFSLMVLLKATALAVISGLFLWDSLKVAGNLFRNFRETRRVAWRQLHGLGVYALPALSFAFLYWVLLPRYGLTEWRDLSLGQGDKGSFAVVGENLLSFRFLNIHLAQNLFNLLIFNFQWVYSLLTLACFLLLSRSKRRLFNSQQRQFFVALVFLSAVYALLVLSFPTWTIARYGLPLYPLLFLSLAAGWEKIGAPALKHGALLILLTVVFVSNFYSLDPLTRIFASRRSFYADWPNFYSLAFWYFGHESVTYNRQFLDLVSEQNKLIGNFFRSGADVLLTDCDRLKLGEKIWSITLNPNYYPALAVPKKSVSCLNIGEISEEAFLLADKTVYLRESEREEIETALAAAEIRLRRTIVGD